MDCADCCSLTQSFFRGASVVLEPTHIADRRQFRRFERGQRLHGWRQGPSTQPCRRALRRCPALRPWERCVACSFSITRSHCSLTTTTWPYDTSTATMVVAIDGGTSDAAPRLRALGYDDATLLRQFHDQGYVIVNGVIPSDPSSPLHIDSLRHSAELATQLTRDGLWPHRRVVDNAFPPFTKVNGDSWGVQHLLNPKLDKLGESSSELSTQFQQFYASSPLLDIASLLIGAQVEDMQMELFNLLINPASHRFALGWHRDDVRPDVSQREEQTRLNTPTYGVQFNTALYDDDCLFIVPGTHRRLRTDAEVKANNAQAPPATQVDTSQRHGDREDGFGADGSWIGVDPPDTLRVKLKAGQTAFYSQRILHRASYLPSAKRATLHGCFGDASQGGNGPAERARNVLQHGVEWMRDPEFGESLPDTLRPSKYAKVAASTFPSWTDHSPSSDLNSLAVWANLLRMDAAYADKGLGFSLANT
ncbi:phytanoyl-CoA dioxygenase [Pseudozyma hubeiensis SY62]|uniref:Phytanoyl-CoA dioxygenase n=1 Tax=Pseudozyma hubeiensis (strain SY62) TaxID=1305764 RepID=R9PAY5_PSEHS|nr:phytanoyl-CoA dioxygenase [Pseudozyma hubeiensis SY62]GAC95240.1 phytanoyl-CoA dioxygenase [Pseudozyma hubeiensis SY62]